MGVAVTDLSVPTENLEEFVANLEGRFGTLRMPDSSPARSLEAPPFLHDYQIEAILAHTVTCQHGIVAVSVGIGYCERQLIEAGCDVKAYSAQPGPDLPVEVSEGDHKAAAQHPERALFIGYPGVCESREPMEAIEAYARAGGNLAILHLHLRTPRVGTILDPYTEHVLRQLTLLQKVDGPGWYSSQLRILDCSAVRSEGYVSPADRFAEWELNGKGFDARCAELMLEAAVAAAHPQKEDLIARKRWEREW